MRRLPSSARPSQPQLLLPLCDALAAEGGAARPQQVYDRVACALGVADDVRNARGHAGGAGTVNLFERDVRWAQQRAKLLGLVMSPERNQWQLTDAGRNGLRPAAAGVVVTIYETAHGMALWADAESALAHLLPGSINCVLTSPPYPVLRLKSYQEAQPTDEYIRELVNVGKLVRERLTDDGSFMLNLGEVWNRGMPTQSTYLEEVLLAMVRDAGFHLAQRLYWENPSKLPSPAAWCTVKRVRVTPSVEMIYWLSKTPHPKARQQSILRPYSASMQRLLAKGGEHRQVRPSGHVVSEGGFSKDHGGSIPHSLFSVPNTRSAGDYERYCKTMGLPIHPARFPVPLVKDLVLLTTDEQDVVADIYGGSGTTARVCESLKRRWITTDRALTYVVGSAGRFIEEPGFVDHFGLPAAA